MARKLAAAGRKTSSVNFPGDTVWFEPGERHWHGAAPNHLMIPLAVQQADAAGNAVTWLEHVTDTDYNRAKS